MLPPAETHTARIISEPRARSYKPAEDVPFIRIRGKWLQRAGFDIGDDVTISVVETLVERALIIKLAPRAQQPQ